MAWTTDMVLVLRVLLNDVAATTYTDLSLQRLLTVAGFQVQREVDLDNTYIFDPTTPSISPDPTLNGDESFVNLTTMKAACILDRSSAVLAASRGIYAKDGSSSVDLRGIAQAKIDLLMKGGWCAAYAEAKQDYVMEQAGVSRTGATVAGRAILRPFACTRGSMAWKTRAKHFSESFVATHTRIDVNLPIRNGDVTVAVGGTHSTRAQSLQRPEPDVIPLPSGDSLTIIQNLSGRYSVDPSGWSA